MTPELPRAPMSAPRLAAAATRSAGASRPTSSASSSAARTVATMFVPVSPSGTGNTFRALISSTCFSMLATALRNASSRPDPVQCWRAIRRRPSGDVRAARGEVVGGDLERVARAAGPGETQVEGGDPQTADVDRQAVDLAAERAADRVADG